MLARRFVSKDNLPEGKTGTFIQMSSSNALAGVPTGTAYGASKLAADRVIGILGMGEFEIRCTVNGGNDVSA